MCVFFSGFVGRFGSIPVPRVGFTLGDDLEPVSDALLESLEQLQERCERRLDAGGGGMGGWSFGVEALWASKGDPTWDSHQVLGRPKMGARCVYFGGGVLFRTCERETQTEQTENRGGGVLYTGMCLHGSVVFGVGTLFVGFERNQPGVQPEKKRDKNKDVAPPTLGSDG